METKGGVTRSRDSKDFFEEKQLVTLRPNTRWRAIAKHAYLQRQMPSNNIFSYFILRTTGSNFTCNISLERYLQLKTPAEEDQKTTTALAPETHRPVSCLPKILLQRRLPKGPATSTSSEDCPCFEKTRNSRGQRTCSKKGCNFVSSSLERTLQAPRKKRETCNTAPGDPDSAGGDPTPQEGPQDYSKTEYKNLSPLSPHSTACRGNPEASPDRDSLNPKSRHLGETLHPQPPGPEGPDFHWRSDPQESLSLDQVEVSPRNPPLACLQC
ncbi:hypothetical protein NDU88_001073 [Pleurodeles waltl]|uniref:Uncharacterized protein n=1 Tax=Pleurodeles waltl TaxID=8319 RepID=A0AAV7S8T3_PLEWA|nr:hypothetical protein NDU88_001073 [Pleurodeles waltl]